MLAAVRDAGDLSSVGSDRYLGDDREGLAYRRALKNCVFEYCESAQKFSPAFRKGNHLSWERIDRMRFNLAHTDYPEVTPDEVWAFVREIMLPSGRRLRNAKFPKDTDPLRGK